MGPTDNARASSKRDGKVTVISGQLRPVLDVGQPSRRVQGGRQWLKAWFTGRRRRLQGPLRNDLPARARSSSDSKGLQDIPGMARVQPQGAAQRWYRQCKEGRFRVNFELQAAHQDRERTIASSETAGAEPSS
jgi:hypothetical protein